MRKLLSTDMDGTLVFNRTISPRDIAALRRWRRAGNLLVMNTGRSNTAIASALADLEVAYDYAVLNTGGVLTDGTGMVLRARTLPHDVVGEVLARLRQEDQITVFATTLSGDLELYDSIGSGTELLTLFSRGGVEDLAGRDVVGIPLRLGDPQTAGRIVEEVRRRWGAVLEGVRNQDFVDLIPAGASKGAGLIELVDMLTAPGGAQEGEPISIYTVGDSWNDIPMHEVADVAIAMDGSPVEVVESCTRTTTSVAELIDWALAEPSP